MDKIFGKTKHIHFIGIGGIGMSGMAELLFNHGFIISGSDILESERIKHLKKIGLKINIGHKTDNIKNCDLVVYSSAINKSENIEISESKKLNIPIIKRAELLGEMIKIKKISLAVSGTHGKTTTSSMIGNILHIADLKPTVITGGIVNRFNSNNISGNGDIIVVEADEFDKSFLSLTPTYISINNIELEHLDIFTDLDDLKKSFIQFANSIPFYGNISLGIDSEHVKNILPEIKKSYKTFGINQKADIMAKNIKYKNNNTFFDVWINNKKEFNINLKVPGLHNIYNALSAIAISLDIEVKHNSIIEGLKQFCGVKRRFEIKYDNINDKNIMIIDDYAHHPSEIYSTINAAKSGWPDRRIICIFQPHLFSRTQDFYKEFSKALMHSNINILAPIFPAREKPIKNVSSEMISKELLNLGHDNTFTCKSTEEIPGIIKENVTNNDIILIMGAGNIYKNIDKIYSAIINE